MSDASDAISRLDPPRRLAEAVRAVKNAEADRDDVVIDMRDAERMRLEIFANELKPVIAEVPAGLDMFDFALSAGLKPRFWVDSVSHVGMGHDKRVYRFLKDTRNGRVVLAESADPAAVAERVTRYIAERMVERERMLEGGAPVEVRAPPATGPAQVVEAQTVETAAAPKPDGGGALIAFATFLLGALFGFALFATQLWDRIAAALNP